MYLPTGGFLLRMIDIRVEVALQRPIPAGGVRIQPTACLHRDVGRFLHRLHREIAGRLDNDRALPTDPRDNRWPIFVIMASAGLAFLATTTRLASQRFLPAVFRLALVPGRVREVIRFNCAHQLALHLVGQGRIAPPPAPPIACPDMDTHLPRNAPGRACEAQQQGRENPVRQLPLALGQQGIGEIVEGALAPSVVNWLCNGWEDSHMFMTFLRSCLQAAIN
jgi:hypothetical protein